MSDVRAAPDAIVVGGGLVGWATAYALARRGLPALVIDAGDDGAATFAGAGMITPGTNLDPPPGYLPLAIAATRHYPPLITELAEAGCGETGYATPGAIYVARDGAEVVGLERVEHTLNERRDAGMALIGAVERISGDRARELFPPLSPGVPAAVWYAGGSRVSGRAIRAAIRTGAIKRGCRELAGRATLERAGNRLRVVDPLGERHDPEVVVLATGAWTEQSGAEIGIRLRIEPQKGQIIHLEWADESPADWPLLESAGSHYMLGAPERRIIAGATRETGSGFDTRVTARGLHEVLTEALAIAPGVGPCRLAEIRVGLRPLSADRLPAIGRLGDLVNGWICAGHGASGLTLGPVSGELLAQAATGETPEIDLAPYSPSRF
jgi:D-amino-acid dehydrogenase